MRILVGGAGVIGTLYAGKLQEAGHSVTVLARGQRLDDIRHHGLVLEDMARGVRSVVRVAAIEQIYPNDSYDAALITVRRDQLAGIMPKLLSTKNIPALVFMLNNPNGSADLIDAFGKDRVMLGFPGAGGTREDYVVRYAMISQQPTTLGEADGSRSSRLLRLVKTFQESGFPTRVERHMDAWLKTHAFFVTAVSGAIYLSGGDCQHLSGDPAALRLMVEGVREGFAAVRSLPLTVTPFPLRALFTWLPQTWTVRYWRRFFARETADYVFGRHVLSASVEMLELTKDCRALLRKSGVDAHALPQLYGAIEAYASRHRTEPSAR